MRVCLFGIYDPAYSRNDVLKEGLERLGHEVVHCRVNPREVKGFRKYVELYKAYRALPNKKFDHVIVAFPGHTVVWLAFLLFGRRIIFDAFVSLYDSNVYDRALYSRFSIRAFRDWMLDWYSCTLASRVLLDTNEHISYFHTTFGIKKEKCIRVFVGIVDTLFVPQENKEPKTFTVHFNGSFIPLQGIEYIVDAARMLLSLDIQFRILGAGVGKDGIYEKVEKERVTNITFVPWVKFSELPQYIADSHIVLGIFGNTPKAQRVIPNKVYEALAMGKAIITADTPAIRELLTHGENAFLVETANPEALKEAIMTLKNDDALRQKIGQGARALYCEKILPEHLVGDLLKALS